MFFQHALESLDKTGIILHERRNVDKCKKNSRVKNAIRNLDFNKLKICSASYDII